MKFSKNPERPSDDPREVALDRIRENGLDFGNMDIALANLIDQDADDMFQRVMNAHSKYCDEQREANDEKTT